MNMQNFKNKILFITLLIILLGGISNVYARTVDFSGYTWNVKETANGDTMGPGGNNWGSTVADDQNDVHVDNSGKLHLFVSQRPDGSWYSSEVTLDHSLGYGKYTFDFSSPVDKIDQNLVAAPFIYKNDQHELDIEYSYWKDPSSPNLHYTVQPIVEGQYDATNQHNQTILLNNNFSKNIINWTTSFVNFKTLDENGNLIGTEWTKNESGDGTVGFQDGTERAHINFWQVNSSTPLNGVLNELIVNNFTFEAAKSTSTPIANIIYTDTTTIIVSWNNVVDATSYQVSSTASTTITTSNTSTTFTDLTPATQYFFQVREFNGTDYSDFSATISTTTIATTTNNSGGGNGGGGNGNGGGNSNTLITQDKINSTVDGILLFFKIKQDADGHINDTSTSDWAAMSFGGNGIYSDTIKKGDAGINLKDYIYNLNIGGENNLCAAYPRHILALLASGVSKTDTKIIDLKKLMNEKCVLNNSYGMSEINDDIFALISMLGLDEDIKSPIVQTSINDIKSNQDQNSGAFVSWGSNSPDFTGAAINALKNAKNKGADINDNIINNAVNYLKKSQLTDGGWGCSDWPDCKKSDALTTSWAVMGINALGETQAKWFNTSGLNPWYILTSSTYDADFFNNQDAVPALLGKTWPIILDPKPVTNNQNNGGGGSYQQTVSTTLNTTSTLIATTTVITSTSTTSTLPIITTTTPIVEIATSTTSTMTTNNTEKKPVIILSRNSEIKKTFLVKNSTTTTKDSNQTTTTKPQPELSAGQPPIEQNKTLDNLPLDTPTKRTAKKILAISGGSALIVGVYLGLRLFKNVI